MLFKKKKKFFTTSEKKDVLFPNCVRETFDWSVAVSCWRLYVTFSK